MQYFTLQSVHAKNMRDIEYHVRGTFPRAELNQQKLRMNRYDIAIGDRLRSYLAPTETAEQEGPQIDEKKNKRVKHVPLTNKQREAFLQGRRLVSRAILCKRRLTSGLQVLSLSLC